MPYTVKQIGLFRAAGYNRAISQRMGIPMEKARQLSEEGAKPSATIRITNALMKRRA